MSDELRLEWIPLSQLKEWSANPKLHALDSIVESFKRRGFRDAVLIDNALGENTVIAGNGRIEALRAMKQNGQTAPIGIRVQGDEWLIPVQAGMSSKNAAEAASWGLDHNSISMLGGDFTAFDIARLWDGDAYTAMLTELAQQAALPVSVSGKDIDALADEQTWGDKTNYGFSQLESGHFFEVVINTSGHCIIEKALGTAMDSVGCGRGSALVKICEEYLAAREKR